MEIVRAVVAAAKATLAVILVSTALHTARVAQAVAATAGAAIAAVIPGAVGGGGFAPAAGFGAAPIPAITPAKWP